MFYFSKKVRLFSQNDVLFLFYFLINPTMTTGCLLPQAPNPYLGEILDLHTSGTLVLTQCHVDIFVHFSPEWFPLSFVNVNI